MKELEEQIQKTFGAMVSNGKLAALIEENVEKAVTQMIRSAFDYHSPFTRALSEYLNKNLRVDLDGIGLAGYGDFLAKVIRQKMDAAVFKYGEGLIGKQIEELLAKAPEQITLSQVIEEFEKFIREEDGEGRASVDCELKDSESATGYFRVKLSAKGARNLADKNYELACDGTGEIYQISVPYSGDITKQLFVGPLFGFTRMLFQMYAAKTRLVVDEQWRDQVD
jgi:hypothetical protein